MTEQALLEGSLIAGRYRLDHHLGEGGMGTVWAATHTVTRRAVAMKFLKDSMRNRKDLRERFLREAAAASSLKHPNVVEIIDVFDFAEGCPVMVMELLRGQTLGAKLLHDERLSLEETAALMVPVLSAVGTAHATGIVHRDLKPDNLFLLEEGGVKVLDFGIAKLSAERYAEPGDAGLLTESGSMLGTPCYMAPEQASGEQPVDHRADIWSLGVILYECLSGVRPIEGDSLAQVVSRLLSAGIMPLERIAPDLPSDVSGLVKQMLTREIARRPASLVEVTRTLMRFTSVRAPEFPAPSGVVVPAPRTMESARPKARLIASRDADPQGPTMLSSPPVNNSLQVEPSPTPQSRGAYWLAGAVVLAVVAWLATERRAPPSAARAATDLPTLPVAAPRAAPESSAASAAEANVGAKPMATTSPASPAAVREPAASLRSKARTKQALAASTQTAVTTDEGLFPGRK